MMSIMVPVEKLNRPADAGSIQIASQRHRRIVSLFLATPPGKQGRAFPAIPPPPTPHAPDTTIPRPANSI
jgi:hypothetical protein